ncbi:MAG: PQQ-binding-like beta-propeller repeat protein [Sandaracinaceae bacterium]|nr:PQQ-binding-like beta-propeller repeat protein [Sandaracinaceae bacterium]
MDATPPAVRQRGGETRAPEEGVALAFGYEVRLPSSDEALTTRSARADIHAMFFQGTLWAYLRGRRVPLVQGPVLLVVQRLIVAVRVLVDAWDSGRPTHVRLRTGHFQVGVRLDAARQISLSLTGEAGEPVTAQALQLGETAEPILRLAADLVRAMIAADRSQGRNLRVRALRDEVRTLRRAVRERESQRGFVNHDPERVRHIAQAEGTSERTQREEPKASVAPVRTLRFGERWRVAVDGLDAGSTFLCGDRLVMATARHTVAIGRERGEVLWVRAGVDTSAFMAGTTLVRTSADGRVELCDVSDGEPFATARVDARAGTPQPGMLLGGNGVPPMVALMEGGQRVVALDLRTGQPRWRFTSRSASGLQLKRVGRVLLMTTPEGTLHAVDTSTGDELWCYATKERLATAPVVVGDRVVLAAGALGARHGSLHVVDLYSGKAHFTSTLDGAPLATPVADRDGVAVAVTRDGGRRAIAYRCDRDEVRWDIADPGLGVGAATLIVDDLLVCNSPEGRLSAVEIATGATRWSASLAEPGADDVPRRLEPVLRGGALFVPSSTVHVLRPHDGSRIGEGLRCELVPDWIRVDERGWVFVAEESGHVNAHAPVPHLELVRS